MKIIKNLIIAGAVATLASCSMSYPGFATKNPTGSKVGVAQRTIVLGIAFGTTDLSLQTAAKNGKINKISTVDYAVKGGLFSKTYSVTVTGE